MIDITLPALTFLSQIVMGLVVPNSYADPVDTHEELYCLALNAYHEARGEGMDEMLAVSQVAMNRVERHIHATVCQVVTEGPVSESWRTRQDATLPNEERVYFPVLNKCQFSWYCDGKSDAVHNLTGWEDAVIAAYLVYNGYGEDRVDGALYYYAHKRIPMPKWAKRMTVTAVLNGHTYLK